MHGSWIIKKRFTFSAAHHLPLMRDGHKCKRPHGHNYVVEVGILSHRLNSFGMVVDFADLDFFNQWLQANFDHQDINKVLPGIHPTAENLAKYFCDHIEQTMLVEFVTVWENEKCCATYTPR